MGFCGSMIASPRVEPVAVNEHDAESRQGLPAPAHRRTSGVRAVLDLDRDAEQLLHPRETSANLVHAHRLVGDFRLPGQPQQPPAFVHIVTEHFATSRNHLDIVG